MVTGGPEEIRNRPHTGTGIREEIPYCYPGTSSGKEKKTRSTRQPQFRSQNTPATIEADQILLALQKLAPNSNSANFNNNNNNNNNNRISNMPKLLKTAMPTFDGNSEKLELFDYLLQCENPQPTDRRRQNKLRKYVKPQPMVTMKHKFQRLVFNPANQKLKDFLDELHKLAKDAFGVATQEIIEQFTCAKNPPPEEIN